MLSWFHGLSTELWPWRLRIVLYLKHVGSWSLNFTCYLLVLFTLLLLFGLGLRKTWFGLKQTLVFERITSLMCIYIIMELIRKGSLKKKISSCSTNDYIWNVGSRIKNQDLFLPSAGSVSSILFVICLLQVPQLHGVTVLNPAERICAKIAIEFFCTLIHESKKNTQNHALTSTNVLRNYINASVIFPLALKRF